MKPPNEREIEYEWVLKNLAISNGTRILNVGSGFSPFSLLLAYIGFQVDVIEPNCAWHSMMVSAAKALSRPDKRGVRFYNIKMEDSDFRESHDIVLCISTLEHCEDDEAVMKAMIQVCVAGGYIFLTVPYDPTRYVENVYPPDMAARGALQRVYNDKRLRELLKGLFLVKTEFIHYRTDFVEKPYPHYSKRVRPKRVNNREEATGIMLILRVEKKGGLK